MKQYIDKSALVAVIEKLNQKAIELYGYSQFNTAYNNVLESIDTLEVKDPYEQCVQYDSVKAGIQAHAETYSFNIESQLFPQLTKEQQALWRKEIEQACISGGDAGVTLARDQRYKENLEVKEVDLEKHLKEDVEDVYFDLDGVAVKGATYYLTVEDIKEIAKHFFELGLKAQKG